MRELKFRVWNGYKTKEFKALDRFYVRVEDRYLEIKAYNYDKDYAIEQYTGLKDKNDKEIYEGDIIQEEINLNTKMTDGTFKYKVFWNEEMLCWSLEHIGNESIRDDLWECNSSVEVIGNIHENPELLEGSE